MIPAGLKLYNFTAYGADTPELDFRPLQLVVLSGPNGAGKSSILDSITWAVWGWSRAGDSADQLVRLGTKEMWVDLTFELESVEYQIIRTRKVGNPGSTTLQFFANGGKTNLTEGTIKATQEKIIQTLHLTYDTFVNSSYIRQDRANEFTIKSPNERKEILADILGLDAYDRLEEEAKKRAHDSEQEIALLDIQLEELSTELETSSTHQETQTRTETELQDVRRKLTTAEKELAAVTAAREVKLKSYEAARVKAERSIKLQTEIANLELELGDLRDQIVRLRELTTQAEVIEKGYARLQELRNEVKKLEGKKTELLRRKDEALVLEQKINTERTGLQSQLSSLESRGRALAEELKEEEAELTKAKAAKKTCPTCGQEIGADEHARIVKDLQARVDGRQSEVKKLRVEYTELQTKKPARQDELEKMRSGITELEEEIKPGLELQSELDSLTTFEDQKRELDVASAKITTITATGKKLKNQQDRLKKDLAEEKSVDLSMMQAELTALDRERDDKDLALRSLQQEEISIHERLAEAKQLVTRATQVGKMIKDKQTERNEAGIRKIDYEDLAAAFGKRGIQAMLIESAIPEIEDEANALLDRMTDGRMKVQLLTQRESKTGDTIETLDIIISDELGARPYEMYSGGESFRINLALRLALSRLLTHRAGAKLQFLIIDEGFGTQDAQGKYKVVEAINAIRDDFAKILVVTHDPELKEAFPQRIEVSRNSNGSTFEVYA